MNVKVTGWKIRIRKYYNDGVERVFDDWKYIGNWEDVLEYMTDSLSHFPHIPTEIQIKKVTLVEE